MSVFCRNDRKRVAIGINLKVGFDFRVVTVMVVGVGVRNMA